MTDLPAPTNGQTYTPRTPHPDDFTVTPLSLAYELRAFREGWSRNVWRRIEGRGFELLLWSRHFHDTPPLAIHYRRDERTRVEVEVIEGGDGTRFEKSDPATLARYRWSFDPSRYAPTAPEPPLRGIARLRRLIEDRRTITIPAVPFQAPPRIPARRRWSVLDEGGPLDGGTAL